MQNSTKNTQLKLLFQNRPPNQWIGGDMVQLQRTMEEMQKLGHICAFNGQPLITPALALRYFDIVHTFNFSMPWTKYQIWAAKRQNKKLVCSMIYHEGETFIPFTEQQIMLDSLDLAIFLTEGEKDRVRRHLKLDESKCVVIPNGIDSFWFEKDESPIKEPYILTVGRLDGTKGQLNTAIACESIGIKYICVGEETDKEYVKQCKDHKAICIGSKGKEDLRKLYAGCSVFVLASQREVMPLTLMEAGAQAKPCILTDTCEWDVDVFRVNAKDSNDIELKIRQALEKKEDIKLRDLLKTMSWENVAKQIEEQYVKITSC